jgi:hypothetical protein
MDRMQAEGLMIELLTEWVRENRPALEQGGVGIEMELGPACNLPNALVAL